MYIYIRIYVYVYMYMYMGERDLLCNIYVYIHMCIPEERVIELRLTEPANLGPARAIVTSSL